MCCLLGIPPAGSAHPRDRETGYQDSNPETAIPFVLRRVLGRRRSDAKMKKTPTYQKLLNSYRRDNAVKNGLVMLKVVNFLIRTEAQKPMPKARAREP